MCVCGGGITTATFSLMSRKFAFIRGRAHGKGEELGKNTTNYTVDELSAIALAFRGTPIQVTHQGMESCKGVAVSAEVDDEGWLVITGAIDKGIPGAIELIEEVRSGGMGLSLGVPINFKYSSRANQVIANKGLPIEVSIVETPDRDGCYISDVDSDDPLWSETIHTIWQAEHDTQNARDIIKAAGESFASDISKAFEQVKDSLTPHSATISPDDHTFPTSTSSTSSSSDMAPPPVADSAAAALSVAAASQAHTGNPDKKRDRSDVEQDIAANIGDAGATDASLHNMALNASKERMDAIDAAKKASEIASAAAELAATPGSGGAGAPLTTRGEIDRLMDEDPSLVELIKAEYASRKKRRTDAANDLPSNAQALADVMKKGTEAGIYSSDASDGITNYLSQLSNCRDELTPDNAMVQNDLIKNFISVASSSIAEVERGNVRNSELQASMEAHNARLRSTPGAGAGHQGAFNMPPGFQSKAISTASGGPAPAPAQSPAPAQMQARAPFVQPESAQGSPPSRDGATGFGPTPFATGLVRAHADSGALMP